MCPHTNPKATSALLLEELAACQSTGQQGPQGQYLILILEFQLPSACPQWRLISQAPLQLRMVTMRVTGLVKRIFRKFLQERGIFFHISFSLLAGMETRWLELKQPSWFLRWEPQVKDSGVAGEKMAFPKTL